MHCRLSGVADELASNEASALQRARAAVRWLSKPRGQTVPLVSGLPPKYPASEIYGILNQDPRRLFDVREIIARIVDDSELDEFKALYGTTLVCGFASIMGYPVGILANNGILFSESALKGTHFIQLCAQRQIPLVFLQNVNGFMVGKKYEQAGIAKDGAKLVSAVACAQIPKFTVIIGGSFGAGNYAMCGRAYDPNFLWIWPNARISVMGGEQAAGVLNQIRGKTQVSQAADEKIDSIAAQYEKQSSAYYASARLWDDGMIDPVDTRRMLGLGLQAASGVIMERTRWGVFRM